MSDAPSLPFFYAEEEADLLVVNPLPWDREVRGPLSPGAVWMRGVHDDPTASRHSLDRDAGSHPVPPATDDEWQFLPVARYRLPATTVPGYGYAAVAREEVRTVEEPPFDERATVETERYRLEFDRERGGLRAWHDRRLDRQWIDGSVPHSLGAPVHERPVDDCDTGRSLLYRPDGEDPLAITGAIDADRGFQSDWHADRRGPTEVCRHRVYEVPGGYEVRQRLEVVPLGSDVELAVSIPARGDTLAIEAAWRMGTTTGPEATYLPIPIDLADPTARVDVGGQAVEVGVDQLPGTCRDYYTAQRWVDVADDDGGITVGCPVNPLVQFGEFSFARDAREVDLDRGLVLGWVTNNYWNTNFAARQPGPVRARYHLTPHDGFDETTAHRLGAEAEHAAPLVQPLSPDTSAADVAAARLLDLPALPVRTLAIRPDTGTTGAAHRLDEGRGASGEGDALVALLYNASDDPVTAAIGPGIATPVEAEATTTLGAAAPERTVEVDAGTVSVDLPPRETRAVRLRCRPTGR